MPAGRYSCTWYSTIGIIHAFISTILARAAFGCAFTHHHKHHSSIIRPRLLPPPSNNKYRHGTLCHSPLYSTDFGGFALDFEFNFLPIDMLPASHDFFVLTCVFPLACCLCAPPETTHNAYAKHLVPNLQILTLYCINLRQIY